MIKIIVSILGAVIVFFSWAFPMNIFYRAIPNDAVEVEIMMLVKFVLYHLVFVFLLSYIFSLYLLWRKNSLVQSLVVLSVPLLSFVFAAISMFIWFYGATNGYWI